MINIKQLYQLIDSCKDLKNIEYFGLTYGRTGIKYLKEYYLSRVGYNFDIPIINEFVNSSFIRPFGYCNYYGSSISDRSINFSFNSAYGNTLPLVINGILSKSFQLSNTNDLYVLMQKITGCDTQQLYNHASFSLKFSNDSINSFSLYISPPWARENYWKSLLDLQEEYKLIDESVYTNLIDQNIHRESLQYNLISIDIDQSKKINYKCYFNKGKDINLFTTSFCNLYDHFYDTTIFRQIINFQYKGYSLDLLALSHDSNNDVSFNLYYSRN